MPKLEKELKLTRVNYNLPTVLVEKVKDYSIKLGIPTTQGVVLLLNKALEQNDMMEQLPKLINSIEDLKVMQNESK